MIKKTKFGSSPLKGSRKGTRFHDSIGKTYSKLIENESIAGYSAGDILGFYIKLPLINNNQLLPESCKDQVIIESLCSIYASVSSMHLFSIDSSQIQKSFILRRKRWVRSDREETNTLKRKQSKFEFSKTDIYSRDDQNMLIQSQLVPKHMILERNFRMWSYHIVV